MTAIPTPQFPDDERQVVRGIEEDGTLVFEQVGVEELIYTGRYGAIANSSTANSIAIGDHYFTLDVDDGKFRIGDNILITSLDDPDCFMWGEVIGKDTVSEPVRLRVYVDDISDLTNGETSNWELQVVGRPKFGITKDVSTTSINPTTAGPFTFTVTADKFFPTGGKLLMIPLEAPSVALVGKVEAYSGTSLVVTKNATNATTGPYTSWAIFLLDAPQNAIPLYQINGLLVKENSGDVHDIDISAGSVRDSTNTVDLILTTGVTKQLDAVFAEGTNQGAVVLSSNLTGTVATNVLGPDLTGTGTNFIGDLYATSGSSKAFLSDYSDQVTVLGNGGATQFSTIVTVGSESKRITTVSSDTAAVATLNWGSTASGLTYKRGGVTPSSGVTYAVGIARKDTDGSVHVFATAFTGSGAPDLPSGCTYYRIIALVLWSGTAISTIEQPLRMMNYPTAEYVSVDDSSFVYVSGDNVQSVLLDADGELDLLDTRVTALEAESTSGTYTPTVSNTVNLDSTSTAVGKYLRVGNIVYVQGRVNADATTAAGTATSFDITLPTTQSADFANASQALGVVTASPGTSAESGTVSANAGTKLVTVEWNAQGAANVPRFFSFMYEVL